MTEPWYDDMVQSLVQAQASTKRAHSRLAEEWTAAAQNLDAVATHYEHLAVLVPAPASVEYHGLAMRWKLAAVNLAAIGEAHAQLALAIPEAAQAAADLGTAAERHDFNNIKTVVRGDQDLNEMRDKVVDEVLRRLGRLEDAANKGSRQMDRLEDAAGEAAQQRGQILDALNGKGEE